MEQRKESAGYFWQTLCWGKVLDIDCGESVRYRLWNMNSNLSNHISIALRLEGDTTVTNFPFKFNQD